MNNERDSQINLINLSNDIELKDEIVENKLTFWEKYLQDVAPLNLPTDYQRPAVQSNKAAVLYFNINSFTTQALQNLSERQGVTLYMTLLAAFKVLLHRYTQQEDICVGIPTANQNNILAIRTDLSENPTFDAFLSQLKQTILNAYRYQDTPFEKIVNSVVKGRDLSRSPIFQVMFTFQNKEATNLGKDSDQPIEQVRSTVDLILNVVKYSQGLAISIEYATDLFSPQTIEKIFQHYQNLLSSIIVTSDLPIGQLDILSSEEEGELLTTFNNAQVNFPKDKTIVDLFEEQVKKTPQNIAILFEEEHLTYQELDKKSNQLAHFLRKNGVREESLVGICVERSLEMVVGILAILKSGGAYVPIDPDYPQERIDYMIQDAKLKIVITHSNVAAVIKDHEELKKIEVDTLSEVLLKEQTNSVSNALTSSNLAYVIYTSGSTGKPKGALLTHKNVVRLFFNDSPLFNFDENDVWTMFHSFCFDFSVWEMYGALFYGGRLVIVPSSTAKNTIAFCNLLIKQGVTVLNQTPSAFYILQDYVLQHSFALKLRYIIYGGEALSPNKLEHFKARYPACKLINMYGITETTVHVTYKEITKQEIANPISIIGKAIPTLTCYILDKYQQLLPINIPGELYVGGEGLARGYLNRPELTQERFIPNRFSEDPTARLYKTGDLARWLPDGNLEYLGRIDDQVKIRGYRIELGEIENLLLQHPQVSQCVVLAREDATAGKRLIAYIVALEAYDRKNLQEYLKSSLPDYMVPTLWVELPEFPLTSNGKIDKKSLPNHDASSLLKHQYKAPRNEAEIAIAQIWKELLGVERVGIDDNFFELGGHSIIAIQVVSRIRRLGYQVQPRDLFEHQTIAELSEILSQQLVNGVFTDNTATTAYPQEQGLIHASVAANEGGINLFEVLPSQRRDFLLYKLGIRGNRNISFEASLKNVDLDVFNRALLELIQRHESFRTLFLLHKGEVFQKIMEVNQADLAFHFDDIRLVDDQITEKNRLSNQVKNYSFKLDAEYLYNCRLIRYTENDYLFVFAYDHIIGDADSTRVLQKELDNLYNHYLQQSPHQLDQIVFQPKDFAATFNEQLKEGKVEIHQSYFNDSLKDYISDIKNKPNYISYKQQLENEFTVFKSLPSELENYDFYGKITTINKVKGGKYLVLLPENISNGLQELGVKYKTTLYTILLGVYSLLLGKKMNQDTVIIRSPITMRDRPEFSNIIGWLLGYVVLKITINKSMTFNDFFKSCHLIFTEAYEHRFYPPENIIADFDIPVTEFISGNLNVVIDNGQLENRNMIEGMNAPSSYLRGATPILAEFIVYKDAILLSLDYQNKDFDEKSIMEFYNQFVEILEKIMAFPNKIISDIVS